MDVLAEDPEEKPTPKHKRKSRKKKKKKQKLNQNQDADENPESRKQQDSIEAPELDKKQELSTIPQKTHSVPSSTLVDIAIERLSFSDFVIREKRILDRRERVSKGRQNLQAKRLALRQLRLRATELESPVLATTGKLPADALSPEAVKRIQEIRQKISEDEYAYDRDERVVTIDESALSSEEYQLYRDFARSLFLNYDGSGEAISTGVNPPKESPKITPAPRIPLPLYEYDSKIGEANIAHETLEQLDSERAEYLEKQQQGLELDNDELEFLKSYKRAYRETRDRLRELEKDIKALEPAADETGHLSPSERYIPQLAPSAPTSPLTLPGTTLIGEPLDMGSLNQISARIEGLGHEHTDQDAISEMSIDLNDANLVHTGNASNGLISNAPGFRFDASMDGWLSQLPGVPPPISKSAGRAVTFATREGLQRIRQYLVSGARQTVTSTKSVPPTSSLPGCEDWILVNKSSNTDPNVLVDYNVQNLVNPHFNPDEPEQRDSEQSQNYRKALAEFPELDLASSMTSLSRRQAGTPDIEHKCPKN